MRIQSLPSPFAGCRLWRFALDGAVPATWQDALSPAEQARAARFMFRHDRHRYLAAHAALRQLLAEATGIAAATLSFNLAAHGKPSLAQAPALHFNLSHSHGIGALALSARAEIGVDVEVLRDMPDALALADAQFGPQEVRSLRALPAGRPRDRAFLRCWTRKEACLKAVGIGLGMDTRSFEAGLEAAPRALTLQGGEQLQLMSLAQHDDVLLSLALRCPPVSTRADNGILAEEVAA